MTAELLTLDGRKSEVYCFSVNQLPINYIDPSGRFTEESVSGVSPGLYFSSDFIPADEGSVHYAYEERERSSSEKPNSYSNGRLQLAYAKGTVSLKTRERTFSIVDSKDAYNEVGAISFINSRRVARTDEFIGAMVYDDRIDLITADNPFVKNLLDVVSSEKKAALQMRVLKQLGQAACVLGFMHMAGMVHGNAAANNFGIDLSQGLLIPRELQKAEYWGKFQVDGAYADERIHRLLVEEVALFLESAIKFISPTIRRPERLKEHIFLGFFDIYKNFVDHPSSALRSLSKFRPRDVIDAQKQEIHDFIAANSATN